jgi:hypothetical protein
VSDPWRSNSSSVQRAKRSTSVGPAGEALDIRHRQAEQIGDHRAGQAARQPLHQLRLAVPRRRGHRLIDEPFGERADEVFVPGDVGQRRQEDPANLTVSRLRDAGEDDVLLRQRAAVGKGAGEILDMADPVGGGLVADRDHFAAGQAMHRTLATQP